jgi:hypothetical protein
MTRRTTTVLVGMALVATATGADLQFATGVANADTQLTQHVYNTYGEGLRLHPSGPGINSPTSITMPDGTTFVITCDVASDDVNGDNIWDYGTDTDTGQTGYAADYYIDTNVTQGQEAAQLAAQGVPTCGQSSASNQPTMVNPQSGTGSGGIPIPPVSFDRAGATAWASANVYAPQRYGDDCTWFVSQALWAGGLPQSSDWTDHTWNLFDQAARSQYPGPSQTAAEADYLVKYLVGNGYATITQIDWTDNTAAGAQPGDLIAYHWNDWEQPTVVDHLAIVDHLNADGYPVIDQHSPEHQRYWSWDPDHHGWIQQVDRPLNPQGARVDPTAWLIHIHD